MLDHDVPISKLSARKVESGLQPTAWKSRDNGRRPRFVGLGLQEDR